MKGRKKKKTKGRREGSQQKKGYWLRERERERERRMWITGKQRAVCRGEREEGKEERRGGVDGEGLEVSREEEEL